MGIFPSWKLTNIINQGFGPPSPQEGVTSCHWFRGWQVTTGIGFHIVSCCPLPTAREAERNIYLCKGGPLQHLGECPLFNITADFLVLELIHMGRCTKWDIWKPPSWTLGVSEVETKKRTHEHASKVFQGDLGCFTKGLADTCLPLFLSSIVLEYQVHDPSQNEYNQTPLHSYRQLCVLREGPSDPDAVNREPDPCQIQGSHKTPQWIITE